MNSKNILIGFGLGLLGYHLLRTYMAPAAPQPVNPVLALPPITADGSAPTTIVEAPVVTPGTLSQQQPVDDTRNRVTGYDYPMFEGA